MTKNTPTVLSVKSVSKTFRLPHEKQTSLKGMFLSSFKRKTFEVQQALKDINFEVKKGEFIGIVGRNGSGKSTLLKCIAGVYTPTEGEIGINGNLVPFIELGVGFNPELSGKDNIFLNGALLGFSRNQMEEMYEDIVEFAELEPFMDQKLKNYSSGMQVRLAFSIAIRAKGDILVLDEVLAVGDSSFQKKCFNYFEQLKNDKTTVVLVTHSMEAVERFCTQALLIESGELKKIGTPNDIAQMYSDVNTLSEIKSKRKTQKTFKHHSEKGKTTATVTLRDKHGLEIDTLNPDMDLNIEIEIEADFNIEEAALGIIIFNSRRIPIFANNTRNENIVLKITKGKKTKVKYVVQNVFSNDSHRIKIGLRDISGSTIYLTQDNAAKFASIGRRHSYAVANPGYKVVKE